VDIRYVGLSERGLVRAQNQDAIFLPPPDGEGDRVFVLADGMGGASGGEIASRLAVEIIPTAHAVSAQALGARDGLRQAMTQAADAIFRRAGEQPGLKGMGTTAVALVLQGERAWLANVGDSRGYLWRNGQLTQVTRDHSLVGGMVADGSLTPEEARRHHLRNVLTRVLGNAPQVEVDIFDLVLAPGDRLLLCSDGLHGPVNDQEMGRILAGQAALPEQARDLVELANRRGGPDNISVILVAIDKLNSV
jgi:protein phosphatase